jgi:hypothetical protein
MALGHRRPTAPSRGPSYAPVVLAPRPQLGLEISPPGAPEQLGVPGLGGDLGGAEPGEILVHVRVGKHVQGTRGAAEIFPRFAVAANAWS